ncbi:MAG: thioredoxin family protein [Gemmatimonadaceae bacterium]|nr:thioredoxin family protein [Gemmatimonadaceae bacterium]
MTRFIAAMAIMTLVGGTALLAAGRSSRRSRQAVSTSGMSHDSQPAVLVRGIDGRTRDLWPRRGGVTLFMMTSCSHCHSMLEALAVRKPREGYPRLQVVALDGAASAHAYLDSIGLRNTEVVEPAGSISDFGRTVRVNATPTLILSDSTKRVQDRMVGELGAEDLRRWSALMSAAR